MNNLSLYNVANAFAILMENEVITEREKEIIKNELTELLHKKSINIIRIYKKY